jgi:hypothetical protein
VNAYGRTAMQWWEQNRPQEFAAMQDPTTFFADLGEQVADEVAGVMEQTLTSMPDSPSSVTLRAHVQGARAAAVEQAMQNLVFAQGPEPDAVR